jgi:hypothetical protein
VVILAGAVANRVQLVAHAYAGNYTSAKLAGADYLGELRLPRRELDARG